MLRRLFIRSIVLGVAALCLSSCGGGVDSVPPGGGGAGGTSDSVASSTASSSTASSTASSSGAGGSGGSGNFCADAKDIEIDQFFDGDLAVTGQEDFYRFVGKKGQVLWIDTDAQPASGNGFNPDYIDTVVTLFDGFGAQVARNDDALVGGTLDSELYTILPADGEYCFRVAECWTVAPNPAVYCQDPMQKLFTSYFGWFFELVVEPGAPTTAEIEPNDEETTATAIKYEMAPSGYYTQLIWGTFSDDADVDVFSFTMPANATPGMPPGRRNLGLFTVSPSGPDESGSTSPTSRAWVASANDPYTVLAEINPDDNHWLYPYLDLDVPYLLFVERPPGTTLANDFYFVQHAAGWGNPLELEKGTGENDTMATAEELPVPNDIGYIEGDLDMAPQDVDHFLINVPSGKSEVRATCVALRNGSGLMDLTPSFLEADGSPFPGSTSIPESQMENARAAIPDVNGPTLVVLKIQASSQAPKIKQAFYRCGVRLIQLQSQS